MEKRKWSPALRAGRALRGLDREVTGNTSAMRC